MMKKFNAVTESGTTYDSDGVSVVITSARTGISVIYPWIIRAVPEEALKGLGSIAEMHEAVRRLPEFDVPKVGQRLYVAGRDEWRLSTHIETVEVYE